MKFFILTVVCFLILVSSVIAPGALPGPIKPIKFVVGTPSEIDMLVVGDEETSLIDDGIRANSADAVVVITSDGVDYRIGEVTVNLSDVSGANLSDMISIINVEENKVVLDTSDETEVTDMDYMYLPVISGHNAIVICEGAGSEANTGEGCAANEGVTEKVIYPGKNTGEYTVEIESHNGIDYWKIGGISGTGIQSYFANLGAGSDPTISPEEEIIYLNKDTFKTLVTNAGNEYTVNFKGAEYKIKINNVDLNNEYVSVYFSSDGETNKFSENDYQNFDLDNDGELDMVFRVDSIVYPQAKIIISYYSEGINLEDFVDRQTKENNMIEREGISAYSGSIWSRFFKSDIESKKGLYWFFVAFVLVVVFFGVLGGKIMSKIWHAN